MNSNELRARAERYRQEMLKLYNQSANNNIISPEHPVQPIIVDNDRHHHKEDTVTKEFDVTTEETVPLDESEIEKEEIIEGMYEEIKDEQEDFQENLVEEEQNDEESINNDQQLIIEKERLNASEEVPDPDISEFVNPSSSPNNKKKKFDTKQYLIDHGLTDIGWITVSVTTGERSIPIAGASVIITDVEDGNVVFKASAITDESSKILRIPLPAPDRRLSLDPNNKVQPYATYDINVFADGYFRTRSVDVPVFSGITSNQHFDMVPLPLFMSENDEVITYYSPEPKL